MCSSDLTVLWNNSPADVDTTFAAASSSAMLITKYGQTYPIAPQDGKYVVTLKGTNNNSDLRDQSIYLVGGEPVIVEEGVEPIPDHVRGRIDAYIPVDGMPVYESDRVYVSGQLSLPGTNTPVPCRWEPEVQLWGRTASGRFIKLATGTRRVEESQGRRYPAWDFHNVNVSASMDPEGKQIGRAHV